MESRGWSVSGNRRCLHVLLLVCFCLVKQHFRCVTAAPEAYPSALDNQGLINDFPDSSKQLDSLDGLSPLNPEVQDKRASAFFPLRGKKFGQYGDFQTNPWDTSEDGYSLEEGDKRSQFYPLRGKKTPDDPKRASYFMPMRGRRDDEPWSQEEDKRMSSFMPMRGKKSGSWVDSFQHPGKPGTYPTEVLYPPGSESVGGAGVKRGMGFLPSRGKKSATSSGLGDQDSDHRIGKRSAAPVRGALAEEEEDDDGGDSLSPGEVATTLVEKRPYSFLPMRVRRFESGVADSFGAGPSPGDDADKRALAFAAMRGKKSPAFEDDESEWDVDKRRSSFMPMRGRRSVPEPTPSAEDLSNRTFPLHPVAKRSPSFTAMRGRRSLDALQSDDDDDVSKRASFVPMRGRRSPDGDEKRASHFMPMRGRRGGARFYSAPLPFLMPSGIGSSLMARYFSGLPVISPASSLRSAMAQGRKLDWDSVKRAFHASRGRRNELDEPGDSSEDLEADGTGCRYKRSALRPVAKTHRQYIALKRPMSFFATRGKRTDPSFH